MAIVRDREGGLKGMLKGLAGSAIACAVLFGAAPAFAQFGGGCTREMLQTSVDQYLQAQAEADPT